MLASATILQNILNSDRYLIVAIDCDFNLIVNNASAQQEQILFFGCALAVGDNLYQNLGSLPQGAEIIKLWQKALAGNNFDCLYKQPDDDRDCCYYEVHFMPLKEQQKIVGAIAIAQEVTERIQAEQQRNIAQKVIADRDRILHDIACDRPLSDILTAIALALESHLENAICTIMLLDERKTALIYGAAPNFPTALQAEQPIPIGPKAGSCGTAAYRQKPVIVTDIHSDPLWEGYDDFLTLYNLRSCWSVPIFSSQQELLGTFAIYHTRTQSPQESDWQLIQQFSSLTSIAIENKQNQQSLQDREARFRQALMDAPFPVLIHAEDGEIILINTVVSHLTGYDIAEIPTIQTWTAKVYRDRHNLIRSRIQDLYSQTQRIDEGEFELYSRDNRRLTWYFSSAPLGVLPDGRRTVISMANDITERKQLEQELRQREARLQRLFNSDMIGIGEWDARGDIVDANPALLKLLGYSRSEFEAEGLNWRDLTPPQYTDRDRQSLTEIAQFGVSNPYEKEMRDRQGNLIPLLIGACSLENPNRGFFFAVDISQRKALESSLHQSIQRLENLRSLDLAILSLQPIDRIATEACERLEHLFNYAKVNLVILQLDSQIARWTHTPNAQCYNAAHFENLRSLMYQVCNGDLPYLVGDRDCNPEVIPPYAHCQQFLCLPISAMQDCFGLLFLWYSPIQEIPEQKIETAQEVANQIAIACQQELLHEELKRYTKQLEQRVAERTAQLQEINRELEAFTYSVSHDLRAPLRAIQGFSMALHEDYMDEIDDWGRGYLERLNKAAQKLDCLIQDLLSYSRLSRTEIQFKNINLERAIGNTLEDLSLEIQDKNVQIEIDSPLGWVYSNSTILQQILVNLIQNALKFTASDVQPKIRIGSEVCDENTRRLWIEDNGIGIKPEHQQRIFTLFERLHGSESYTGTGIGLALVKKGIERLRGRVGVESQIGVGSRFWLEFPMDETNGTKVAKIE